MITDRMTALKATLDRLLDVPEFTEDWGPGEAALYEEAGQNFRNRDADLLAEATPHVWSYYEAIRRLWPEHTPVIPDHSDIWDHINFVHGPDFNVGGSRLTPARFYLSFEGEVTWEPEHGLQLVFEEGERVCKVSPYDGHMTNASASNDDSLLSVIFRW